MQRWTKKSPFFNFCIFQKFKTNITGSAYNLGADDDGYNANKVDKNETEIVVPLKHLEKIYVKMTIQTYSNNLNYVINPTFTKVNRLFVLVLARNERLFST